MISSFESERRLHTNSILQRPATADTVIPPYRLL
jgi:hypothetical protein